ncbi:hypothetical protein TVAG_468120 [Trichomonas vaginalis G3]|uniref:Uncharacterized protein n=1 Tax=Trichomonas vaginalis (strain ATCC PRA-98 / G3) TaxID=412133 RepID=A2E0Q1_TRIV3|nr:hypothetical protein TVAGG3_0073680 [Trichomonas vaginalis G3]EAY13796.1 hypothetical protein TVAG_468120 [Trichomonas vaginalis G3]KAI5542688.1 hypothetical protein TVAGG3_0073680 [Trichomonas vaginalis G3]|eukprot:XP_001326019.1 hypothetical protein [Trichomonas vaginalis G3]
MENFDLSSLIRESLVFPELKPISDTTQKKLDYDRYLSETSPDYSIIYDKKENKLKIAKISNKNVNIIKGLSIKIENLAILEDFLISFSEKNFYFSEIPELLSTELPFSEDNAYKSEFTRLEKIISTPSTPGFIYYLVKDNNILYKQKVNPFEPPIEVFSDVSSFSATDNQIIISQLDGIHVYEFNDTELTQNTIIPVIDPIFISGGKTTYSVITNYSFTTYNSIGDIVSQNSSIPTHICEHSCSNTYYYGNRIIFTEPYEGEMNKIALAGGIVGNNFYFWSKNLEFGCDSIPSTKIHCPITIKHDQPRTTKQNNKNAPKQQNQQNQKNSPQKQQPRPQEPINKKKKTGKKKEQPEEPKTFPVSQKLLIFTVPDGSISKKILNSAILQGDEPECFIPVPCLKLNLFVIKSIHSDEDVINKMRSVKRIQSVRSVQMRESPKDFFIIAFNDPPIHEAAVKKISEIFGLEIKPILNVFHCIPDPKKETSKYCFSFLDNLDVEGKVIKLYKTFQDVPVVFSNNLDKNIIDKIKEQYPSVFSQFVNKYTFKPNNALIFNTVEAANELCENNFAKINNKTVNFIRFTPVMWTEKSLHVCVSGNISEEELFRELHQNNQNVVHVFKDNGKNVVVYLTPEAAKQGRNEFSQSRKIKNKSITIIN